MSEFAILALSPGVDFTVARQSQTVFASRVDRHLLDDNMLYRLQQGWSGHRLCTSNT